jgi:hypothetical protein
MSEVEKVVLRKSKGIKNHLGDTNPKPNKKKKQVANFDLLQSSNYS